MELRKMDKLGIQTSLLGFGCMRFPTTADGKIDREESVKMLKKAMEGDGPAVIEVMIEKDEFVLPMLPPGGSIEDIIVSIDKEGGNE